MLTGQECERSRRQQALHCGHSGKSGQRGRRVATGLRGYGACEAAEGVVQKSGAKDESSRSGTLTFNGTHASERGAAARKVEWGPALREFENFVGSRFTPACNTSLRWRHGRGHGRDGGKVLATMAAFVALNGRLGGRSRVCGSQRPAWRESAAQCLILPF